jgi:hypothetical protein
MRRRREILDFGRGLWRLARDDAGVTELYIARRESDLPHRLEFDSVTPSRIRLTCQLLLSPSSFFLFRLGVEGGPVSGDLVLCR